MKNRPIYGRIPVDYAPMQDLSIDIKTMPNPKMNILFFDDLGDLFHFFVFWSTIFAWIAQLIIRS